MPHLSPAQEEEALRKTVRPRLMVRRPRAGHNPYDKSLHRAARFTLPVSRFDVSERAFNVAGAGR